MWIVTLLAPSNVASYDAGLLAFAIKTRFDSESDAITLLGGPSVFLPITSVEKELLLVVGDDKPGPAVRKQALDYAAAS